ncbi:hypothetical protein [Neolewinella sp.]|uniref:hypothetical protein n=1 Tax=Neolewinella sp. TaxID=2993543 RepID=UPI003B51CDE3
MAYRAPRFSIHGIEVDQFAVFPHSALPKEINDVRLKVDFEITPEIRCLVVLQRFQFEVEKQVIVTLQFRVRFQFHKDDWGALVIEPSGSFSVPIELARHLTAICLGTGRGILYEKLQREGTYINLIWPIIDVRKIIQETVTFDLTSPPKK